jgi:hypothetical protein
VLYITKDEDANVNELLNEIVYVLGLVWARHGFDPVADLDGGLSLVFSQRGKQHQQVHLGAGGSFQYTVMATSIHIRLTTMYSGRRSEFLMSPKPRHVQRWKIQT